MKDAYSLPQIDEMLDCLNGIVWFTSLDLKLEYWQVEVEEDCKALTAFTIRPLGFYGCDRMHFGLTNAPATLSMINAKLFRQSTPTEMYYLPGKHHHIFKNARRSLG